MTITDDRLREILAGCEGGDIGGLYVISLDEARSLVTELLNRRSPSIQSGAIPDGWKLVPVEPTEEQIDAGRASENEGGYSDDHYRAMIAASPAPPSGDQS